MGQKSRLDQIKEMLKAEPNDSELRYMLAMEYVSVGNDEEAVCCFADLMAACPEYAPGFHQGARALLRLNRLDEAKTALQKGIVAAQRQRNDHAAGEMGELLASLE